MRPLLLASVLFLVAALPARAQNTLDPKSPLDAGFSQMYELNFPSARQIFRVYLADHPDDPLGQVALASSDLFQIFTNEGVFTSSFFLHDKTFLDGVTRPPNPALQSAFLAANSRARKMAESILASRPSDPTGLYVLTLADGMEADYDSLILKHHVSAIYFLHEASKNAKLLLAVNPHADDAYLALGAANYIIGCLPAYKRFFLGIGGIHGSRKLGMRQLALAARDGHYLRPFAKVMLALADLRERQPALARQLLAQLHSQFPENRIFASELAKLPTPAS